MLHSALCRAATVRKSLLSVEPRVHYGYDQQTLRYVVWPVIRDYAAIYDSYFCRDVERFGHTRPWPTKGGFQLFMII